MDIVQAVHDFFRAGGYGQQHLKGFQYNETQHKLAIAFARAMSSSAHARTVENADGVAETLSRASIGLLQSPTGTGKTLAYAVVAAYLAAQGKRVVISTYTLALLRQVYQGADMRIALDYAEKVTGKKRPQLAQKLGRGNYVSPTRAEKMRAWCDRERIALSASDVQFFEWAKTGGLFMAYRETYGEEPPILRRPHEDPISLRVETALRAGDSKEDHAFYLQDSQDSRDAPLIVTTHHSLLLHGKAPDAGFGHVDVVLSDEADRIVDAADALSGRKFRPIDGERLASRLMYAMQQEKVVQIAPFKTFLKALEAFRKALDGCRDPLSGKKNQDMPVGEALSRLSAVMARVQKHGAIVRRILQEAVMHNQDIPHLREGLDDWLEKLDEWVPRIEKWVNADQPTAWSDGGPTPFWVYTLSWSPFREEGGLVQSATDPLKAYGNKVRQCVGAWVLTSATLSVKATDTAFRSFRGELGCAEKDYGDQPPVDYPAPRNFGHLSLRTTPPNIPPPFVAQHGNGQGDPYDAAWVDHVVRMVAAAAGRDRRVLVLTRSYQDHRVLVPALVSILGEPAVLFQDKNAAERLDAFLRRATQSSATRVILTPGAWEGVEVRAPDGKIWMTELLIPRLPILPSNETLDKQRATNMVRAQADYIQRCMRRAQQGKTDEGIPATIDLQAALHILYDARRHKSLRIFIQGVGRLIRGFADRGTLWVGDPRFSPDDRNGQLFYDLLMRWRPETNLDQQVFDKYEEN